MVSSGNRPSAVVRDGQGWASYSFSPMTTVTLVTWARLLGHPGVAWTPLLGWSVEGTGIWGRLSRFCLGLQRDRCGGPGPHGRQGPHGAPNIRDEWGLTSAICWPTGYLVRGCLTRGKDAFFQLVHPEGCPVLIPTKVLRRQALVLLKGKSLCWLRPRDHLQGAKRHRACSQAAPFSPEEAQGAQQLWDMGEVGRLTLSVWGGKVSQHPLS